MNCEVVIARTLRCLGFTELQRLTAIYCVQVNFFFFL